MRSLRRVTALALSLVLAHVIWVGSGFACVMPDMRVANGNAAAAMMDMSGQDMAGMQMPAPFAQSPDRRAPDDHQDPTSVPWAPAGCQVLGPCPIIAVAASTSSTERTTISGEKIVSAAELTPPSVVRVPEPPPPRL